VTPRGVGFARMAFYFWRNFVKWRIFIFFQIGKTLGVSSSYRQIWLNHLIHDHHLSNITKFTGAITSKRRVLLETVKSMI
jgi:hypothetical protein